MIHNYITDEGINYSPLYRDGLFSLKAVSPSILSLVGITCNGDVSFWFTFYVMIYVIKITCDIMKES